MIHDNYETISDEKVALVDEAFQGVYDFLSDHGLPVAGDDRAEYLVEAIATYIVESAKR